GGTGEESRVEYEEEVRPGSVHFSEVPRLHVPSRIEGATLIAEGDVVCSSDVYHSHVLAAGDIIIKGWCSHAIVVALGSVELPSAIYSHILASMEIRLGKEARFSTLQARGIAAENAIVFGGQLVAADRIVVRQLRWAFGDHGAVLSIGTPYLQQLEQQYWRTQLQELRERLQELQRTLGQLLQQRRSHGSEQVRQLQQEYWQLYEQLQQLEQRSYGLGTRKPVIEVRENVPSDTIVAIHGVVYRVPSELIAVRFSSDGMRIALESLPEVSGTPPDAEAT
ncbi:MAG: FapA family protein, partial [Chlorobiota bacterium]